MNRFQILKDASIENINQEEENSISITRYKIDKSIINSYRELSSSQNVDGSIIIDYANYVRAFLKDMYKEKLLEIEPVYLKVNNSNNVLRINDNNHIEYLLNIKNIDKFIEKVKNWVLNITEKYNVDNVYYVVHTKISHNVKISVEPKPENFIKPIDWVTYFLNRNKTMDLKTYQNDIKDMTFTYEGYPYSPYWILDSLIDYNYTMDSLMNTTGWLLGDLPEHSRRFMDLDIPAKDKTELVKMKYLHNLYTNIKLDVMCPIIDNSDEYIKRKAYVNYLNMQQITKLIPSIINEMNLKNVHIKYTYGIDDDIFIRTISKQLRKETDKNIYVISNDQDMYYQLSFIKNIYIMSDNNIYDVSKTIHNTELDKLLDYNTLMTVMAMTGNDYTKDFLSNVNVDSYNEKYKIFRRLSLDKGNTLYYKQKSNNYKLHTIINNIEHIFGIYYKQITKSKYIPNWNVHQLVNNVRELIMSDYILTICNNSIEELFIKLLRFGINNSCSAWSIVSDTTNIDKELIKNYDKEHILKFLKSDDNIKNSTINFTDIDKIDEIESKCKYSMINNKIYVEKF